jgi:hypothetical protein
MPEHLLSRLRSSSLTCEGEAIVDFFRPVRQGVNEGVLVLTNRRLIFVARRGIVRRSFEAVFSVSLGDLNDIEPLTNEEIERKTVVDKGASSIIIETGQLFISSPTIGPFVQFYNESIFGMVQQRKGLVKHGDEWINPEEERKRVALYISRIIVQDPVNDLARERVHALVRKVRGKNASCCVCGRKDVVAWIVDVVFLKKTCRTLPLERMLIFLRLLCREHEDKWKCGNVLKYSRINGVKLLTIPYHEAVWTATDVQFEAFRDLIEEQGGIILTEILYFKKTLDSEDAFSENSLLMFEEGTEDLWERGWREYPLG